MDEPWVTLDLADKIFLGALALLGLGFAALIWWTGFIAL
jgi:hypothetical protein